MPLNTLLQTLTNYPQPTKPNPAKQATDQAAKPIHLALALRSRKHCTSSIALALRAKALPLAPPLLPALLRPRVSPCLRWKKSRLLFPKKASTWAISSSCSRSVSVRGIRLISSRSLSRRVRRTKPPNSSAPRGIRDLLRERRVLGVASLILWRRRLEA
jgi:hypothetical protein